MTIDYAAWARQAGNRSSRYYRAARAAQRASWRASASAREWHTHYRYLLRAGAEAEQIDSARSLCTLMAREACREAGRAAMYREMARDQATCERKWKAAAAEAAARIEAWRTSPERAAWLAEQGEPDLLNA